MIEIPFDPNLRLGPLMLSWHGIFTAVGIFFGVALPVRLLRGRVSEDDAYAIATWGVVAGIIGARLVHVLDTWENYAADPIKILFLWQGGIAVWGAVIGGVLGGYLVALRRGLPIGLTADAAAAGIGLGLAIGRIGDIINGEHHTTPCDTGICVGYTFPPEQGGLGQLGPVHLAVGYEMVYVLALVALAAWLHVRRERSPEGSALRRWLAPGTVFWGWAFGYGLGRFLISFLRINDPESLFGLRQDQLIGLVAMATAVSMLAVLLSRSRSRGPTPAPA